MFYSKFLIVASVMMSSLPCIASGNKGSDEVRIQESLYHEITDTLNHSTVIAEKGFIVSRKDSVILKGNLRAEEALTKVPGLLVNDNGGPSGLKTISLRGLGSAQTAIYIDGVRVGNLLSGQTDISMLSMGNFSMATVDYAQNSISFSSAEPIFQEGRQVSCNASFIGGSFGTYMPEVSVGYKINGNVTASAHAAATFYDGYREYSAMDQYLGGIDFFGKIKGGEWRAKGLVNYSDRECPGSTTYPYLSQQQDLNGLIQSSLTKSFNGSYSLNANAKVSYDSMNYADDYSNNVYRQSEIQLNSSHLFSISQWCDLSATVSGNWNGLQSDNYEAGERLISRVGIITAGSASFHTENLKAELNLEYKGGYDRGPEIKDDRHCLSPSASIRYNIFKGFDLVAFGRRSCHIPTFNDLYYSFQGNKDLKSERAWLTDIGIDWNKNISGSWSLAAKADGFFNWLTDKITWAPSPEDSYTWLPYNIGKVRSVGMDAIVSAKYSNDNWKAGASARYSYQDARDRTPDASTFNSQIAYIARHTAIICADLEYKGWNLDASWNFRDGRKDSYGAMPSWSTIDMNVSKTVKIKDLCRMTFNLMARNITDSRYEVSSGYPMPGWALYGGITVSL